MSRSISFKSRFFLLNERNPLKHRRDVIIIISSSSSSSSSIIIIIILAPS